MNLSSVTGFIIAFGVIWTGVLGPAPRKDLFLDPHALILVVGGTLAAALIAFPARTLLGLFKLFFRGILFKSKTRNREVVEDILAVVPVAYEHPSHLVMRQAPHPFLEEGYHLLGEAILSEKELHEVLVLRSQWFKKSYQADARILNNLAKFPPAFGLLGASTGMISMMMNLGSGGQEAIGPAMAIALVATFWGIAVANFILLPLADHASRLAADDYDCRMIIVNGILALKRREPQEVIAERLNSLLSVRNRITPKDFSEFKKIVRKSETGSHDHRSSATPPPMRNRNHIA